MSIYYGFLICKNCGVHSKWGEKKQCPFCGCTEGDSDE